MKSFDEFLEEATDPAELQFIVMGVTWLLSTWPIWIYAGDNTNQIQKDIDSIEKRYGNFFKSFFGKSDKQKVKKLMDRNIDLKNAVNKLKVAKDIKTRSQRWRDFMSIIKKLDPADKKVMGDVINKLKDKAGVEAELL